ncbi:MAG: isopenicillin synthase family oxygenase [Actinomycetia bacterium]|nr:isopenicillin synthase family oxygenase [Actinomycetes bacterium]
MTLSGIPILDLAPFRHAPTSPDATRFVDKLRSVCHEHGFFYLTGHGVDDALNDDVHALARRFFALPLAQRLDIANVNSAQFRGYTAIDHEFTGGRPDHRDQLDIGHELPPPRLEPGDPAWLRLRGPNLWPSELPELRPTLTSWMDQMQQVGATVLRALALALDQPPDRFDDFVTPRPEVLVKVIRYPARDNDVHDDDQGVGEHRDTGLVTFVHQDDVGGLQVKLGDNFVDIPKLPATFVVNLGEMMQLLTRGYFAATVHRVVSPPPGRQRISVSYFYNPKLEATLEPITLPPAFAADAPGGESADPTNPILANYGENSLKVRLRAHPDVARRHHSDLIAN